MSQHHNNPYRTPRTWRAEGELFTYASRDEHGLHYRSCATEWGWREDENWLLFIFFTSSLFGAEAFAFRVKGGLVIELVFRVCLKNGLGSFVGCSIFIFSPYPLNSA